MAACEIVLTREALDPPRVENAVRVAGAGAVVAFTGATRDTHLGRGVLRLEYEAQETLARRLLEKLAAQAAEKFGLLGCAIHHRLGRLEIGELSVVIAVSSAHRGNAFDGCRFLIDTLKTTIPIWKKEYYADGSPPQWVGPDGKVVEV